MVRNFQQRKDRPRIPSRGWAKWTGPRDSSLIRAAMTNPSGASSTRPTAAAEMSTARFAIE